MTQVVVLSCMALWAGTTLLVSQLRWFSRPSLVDRLGPYVPGGLADGGRSGLLSLETFADVIGPLSRTIGERVARLFGVNEELGVRLERIHSPLDVTAFRVRQVGRAVAGLLVGAVITAVARPPLPVAFLLMAGLPLLAFLLQEQQVAGASRAWQRRVFLELPVVVEQLAMLMSAGYSLGAGINRLAARGTGACARDLARVSGRVRQGLSEEDALREWAALASVPALDRLVPVLALNREAGDLGRLLSEEARAIRRDVQRELVEIMERRGQEVWVPVTVATLVPGVIFLAVPFIEALRLFAGS